MTLDEAEGSVYIPSLASLFAPPRDVKYPVIKFAKMEHCPHIPPPHVLIPAMKIELDTGSSPKQLMALRQQVPLQLAWYGPPIVYRSYGMR